VDSLCGSFATIFGGFFSVTEEFSEKEKHALFRDNAIRIYGMNA